MSDIIVHEGKKYRKVDRKVREGDQFIVPKESNLDYTAGKVYKVTMIDEDGDPHFIDDIGDRWHLLEGSYDVLEPASPSVSVLESELAAMKEKIQQLEQQLAEAKNPDHKIHPGAYVKLQIPDGSRPRYGWGNVKNGDIGKVASCDGEEVHVDFPAQSGWHGLIHEFVPVTEEERRQAEEAEKWAAIGRKPGEFKVGDLVKFNGHSGFHGLNDHKGIITTIDQVIDKGLMPIHLVMPSYLPESRYNTWTAPSSLELVAPVESVVNLRAEG